MGMPAIATTDHGYVFGAYEFWSKAKQAGSSRSSASRPTSRPGTHRTDKTRVRWGDERRANKDDVSGGGAYTHMTMLARRTTAACTTSSG
jgi:DNA polymerase-3 subunit alpha